MSILSIMGLIWVRWAQISNKTYMKYLKQTKPLNLSTFCRISQPHELRSMYRLLHWNRVAKPVVLSKKNTNLKTIFYWPYGAHRFLLAQRLCISGCSDLYETFYKHIIDKIDTPTNHIPHKLFDQLQATYRHGSRYITNYYFHGGSSWKSEGA